MSRKIIKTIVFSCVILIGLSVGYGTTRVAQFAYAHVLEYVSEIKTPLVFERKESEGLGGPYSQVIESEFNETLSQYIKNFSIRDGAKLPAVSSLSYLVADLETGKVLVSKNINQQLPIASITKLMTAVVAEEVLGLETKTIVTQQAIDTYGTQGNLQRGEQYSVQELLYPLLLESSNDAAEALALAQDRNIFLKTMNDKAKAIGLLYTGFDDASGLSAKNVSTVTDLFRLTQYISKYRSYIFETTTHKTIELGNKRWINNSRFRNDRDYIGGKNGYIDEAKRTHIVIFNENFETDTRKIAYVILRSDDVAYDIKLLRNFVYKNVGYK